MRSPVALSFRDLPLRMKLRRLTLYTTAGALAVACLLIVAVELFRGWQQTARHLSLIVETVGNNARSALVFEDPRFAAEALAVLEIDPRMRSAVLYHPDGHMLASFKRAELAQETLPKADARAGTDLWERTLTVVHAVSHQDKVVGKLVVRADIEEYLRSSGRFAIIAFVVTLLGAVAAYPVWARMQRMISEPMVRLVEVIQQVADTRDYGVRATEQGEDELGRLMGGFNHMLDQLQARDLELERHRRHLEEQIEKRTGELLAANRSLEREVAERRATEADLERFKTTLDQTLDGVVMFDPLSQVIFYANRGAAEQAGVPAGKLRTRRFAELFVGLPGSLLDGMLDQVRGDPLRGATFDAEVSRGDADRPSVEVFLQYIEPAAGEGRCLAILRDVSLQKVYERALKAAKEEAEKVSEAKGQFLANMSHEIRTPMNAIIGFSRLALASDLREKPHDYVANILHSATSLMGIIDNILDLSKIEAERLTIEQTELDLPILLERVLRLVAVRAEQKDLELLCEVSPELPAKLIGDPLRLQQVLVNLLGNAVKFTESGWVRLRVAVESRTKGAVRVIFAVRDTGIGIPQDRVAELFEPFSQADVSHSRRFGGTGLGLAISRRLVGLMGGELRASPAPGGGSEFDFALPFPVVSGGDRAAPAGSALSGQRVLVIESFVEAGALLEAALLREGAAVTLICDPEKPATWVEEDFDIAVVDGKASERRAGRLLESLYAEGRGPMVVWMTGAHDPGPEGLALGERVRTLYKPVCPSALLRALRTLAFRDSASVSEQSLYGADTVPSGVRLKGARVLVVEDIEVNQRIVAEFLVRLGIDVDVASSGNEALSRLHDCTYDLVFMDLQMPGMDGCDTTAAIRRERGLEELPIVAMTAGATRADRERCLSAGMNDHVSKPIDPSQLLGVLDTWIGRASHAAPALLTEETEADREMAVLLEGMQSDIEWRGALQRLGGNGKLFFELLADFLAHYRFLATGLEAELLGGDAGEKIHGLMGVAGNLGLVAVYRAARHLEQVLRAGRDTADAASGLAAALGALDDKLSPLLSQRAAAPIEKGPADIEGIWRILSVLRGHLQTGNFAAVELEPELRKACAGHFAEQQEALSEHLRQLRFVEAEALLDEFELLLAPGGDGRSG